MSKRSRDDLAARKAEAIQLVRENLHKLWTIADRPADKWKEAVTQGVSLWSLLGVREDDFSEKSSKNITRTLLGVVKLFRTYSMLSREKLEVAPYLLDLCVICKTCFRANEKSGVLLCDSSTIKAHAAWHELAASAAGDGRQLDLREAGFVYSNTVASQADALMLSTAALVAGGGGASALSYSTIQKTITAANLFIVMAGMKSGFSSPAQMRKVVLPRFVYALKEEHMKMLKGLEFSIGIDGGSGDFCNGMKVMPIIALSPLLPRDTVLDVFMLPMHETAAIQANLINKFFEDAKLDKLQLKWLGVDNNQLNIKCVQILNEVHGFKVRVARCIDHSLNLVFVSFLAPFEQAFGMQKLLRHVRAYIKAGGGHSRRAALVEHAISLSGIDFTATRWTSFLRAVLYLMGKQTPFELQRARAALTEMAAWSDVSAQKALLEPDEARDRWVVLHDALQSMGEDAKVVEKRRKKDGVAKEGPGEVREVKLNTLLESMVDIEMYGAFFIVSKMFQRVPALFKVLQGDERFEPKLEGLCGADKGKGALDMVEAARDVVGDLASLAKVGDPLRTALLVQTREACLARIEATLEAARKDNEPLLAGKKHFEEDDVDDYKKGATQALDAAMSNIEKVVERGAKEFMACAGMDKVNEALQDMEYKVLYGLKNGVKVAPPLGNITLGSRGAAAPVLDFFGVPKEDRNDKDLDMARTLIAEWHKHGIAMHSTNTDCMTPQRTMMYWRASLKLLPVLGKLAMLRLGRPNGNAAPERFMSLIKDMDNDKAQSMKKETLYNVSMIRGNAVLVRDMLGRGADRIKARTEQRRGPAAAAAAAASATASGARLEAALKFAASVPHRWEEKGEEEEEGEEEGEEKGREEGDDSL